MSTRPDARAAWAAAAVGAAITFAVFWPGLMSVDSSAQFAQARAMTRLDDVVPPVMTLLWRGLDRLVAGPALMHAVLVLAWWGGIAAVLARSRFVTVLAVGLFPPTFLMLGHVWKDVAMAAALLWATAAILARWRWPALLALALACLLRHNAIFAVLPLLAWLCFLPPLRRENSRRIATFAVLAGVLAIAPAAFTHAVRAQPTQPWTVVALWDLAAISIAVEENLLPRSVTYGPPLTVDELRTVYEPYANPKLFSLGRIQLSLYLPYSPHQVDDLQRAWFDAATSHPAAYLAHRAALARYLLFGFPRDTPRELVYVPERRVPGDAGLALPAVDTSTMFWRAVEALRPTPLFAGATYLLLAALACAIARANRGAVFALAASSWANTLPLLLISGSAEFRYLAWSVLAALLALVLGRVGARATIG